MRVIGKNDGSALPSSATPTSWGETFFDSVVVAAMIDRLVQHAEALTQRPFLSHPIQPRTHHKTGLSTVCYCPDVPLSTSVRKSSRLLSWALIRSSCPCRKLRRWYP